MPAGTAIFDFDRTLIRQESMAMFLRLLAGRRDYVAACAAAAGRAALAPPARRMAVFRAEVLRRLLRGRTTAQARAAAERLYRRLTWIGWTTDDLARHRDAGRRIVIATGSLSVYMPALLELKGITPDVLLATEIALDGDRMTGEMATASCTWEEKARRVTPLLVPGADGVRGPVWGYGNLPHDRAMLALTDHPVAVAKHGRRRGPVAVPAAP